MWKAIFILTYCELFTAVLLPGQCPGNNTLLKRYIHLKADTVITQDRKLQEYLDSELKARACSFSADSLRAAILQSIGVLYLKKADYFSAVKYTIAAVQTVNAGVGKSSVNPGDLVKMYYNLSIMYGGINKTYEKMKALDSCATIAINLNLINIYCLYSLYGRAEYFFDMGDYKRCIDYAVRCETLSLEFAKDSKNEQSTGMKYVFSSLVPHINSLLQLKQYALAEALLANKIDECNKRGLTNYLGSVFAQLADVESEKGNSAKAFYYLKQALKYEQLHGTIANCKVLLSQMGNLYLNKLNKPQQAFMYYQMALAYNNKTINNKSDSVESLEILSNIGDIYARQGHLDSALNYFQLAFDQLKPGTNETEILYSSIDEFSDRKKIWYLPTLLINKADAFRQQYEITHQLNSVRHAVTIYKIADKFLERIRKEQSDLSSKLFWRKIAKPLYEHAIKACSQYNNMEDAFYFFERSRAVLLNEQLNEQHWLNEEDILKQTQIRKRILQLNMALNVLEASSEKYKELQKELFNQNHELDRLQQLIKEHNPLYYQSFLDTSKITLKDVREKILKDHAAMVEIFDGDSTVYAMVITEMKNYINRIDKSKFDSLSGLYIRYVTDPGLLNVHFDIFTQISRRLYQLIFQDNPLPTGRVIISPEGRYFPFESLITSNNSSRPVYFLTDYAVSYTYSARYLLNNFVSHPASSPGSFMGIAPVNYTTPPGLSVLSGSDLSLQRIQSYLPGSNNLLGATATRNNFLQQFSDYKIIQLYTHASDSSERKEPVIYFADSALYLSELIPEKKPATQLIVLSACETGNGINYQGEGVFSFNRGFAALGVPSSISNLWSIDNVSTYKLTELFYKYLSVDLPLDIALQKAKLEYISSAEGENKLPYYWAAPILVGKTDPIVLEKPFAWKYLFAGIGLAGLVFFGWKKRRKRVSYPNSGYSSN